MKKTGHILTVLAVAIMAMACNRVEIEPEPVGQDPAKEEQKEEQKEEPVQKQTQKQSQKS